MSNDFRSKGPELLLDLAEHVGVILVELENIDKERAAQLGREVSDRMAAHWGGQNVYFPMGWSHKLSKRDETIYQEFNGINHSELARKYGVSLQWIYKIVKAVQKEEMAKRQPDMFGT